MTNHDHVSHDDRMNLAADQAKRNDESSLTCRVKTCRFSWNSRTPPSLRLTKKTPPLPPITAGAATAEGGGGRGVEDEYRGGGVKREEGSGAVRGGRGAVRGGR